MPLTAIEEVRLTIGDTDSSNYVLTTAQIQHCLDESDDDVAAASLMAATFAYRVMAARAASVTAGRMAVDYAKRAEVYRQVMLDLGGGSLEQSYAAPFLGGLEQADIDSEREDTSHVQPAFTHDLHTNQDTSREGLDE